jgi:hypothetical protein
MPANSRKPTTSRMPPAMRVAADSHGPRLKDKAATATPKTPKTATKPTVRAPPTSSARRTVLSVEGGEPRNRAR